MKKTQYLLFMVAMLYALCPVWAQAAYDTVTTEGGSASIVLTADSSSYIIDASNRVESFTVNASTIAFDVLPGSVISITSNDRKAFTYSSTSCETIQKTCSATFSQLFIQCGNQSVAHTITVTPSATCTGSSGVDTGGGGGGGSSAPVKSTPEPEKVVPKPVEAPKPKVVEPPLVPVISMDPVVATFTIGKSQVLRIGGEDHTVNVSAVSKTGVVSLTIQSKPVKISLKKGQTVSIDTNGDKVNDMKVTLLAFVGGSKPQLKFTPLAVTPKVIAPDYNTGSYQFKKNLSMGSKGADVLALQKALRQMGYFTYPTDTGSYGVATRDAVKKFQKANGIAQVGNVGSATLKALNKL